MSFTGKATYSAGAGLPEIAEDVSDIIGLVSPHETALLDYLGDARREATSTVHEWIESSLVPSYDRINQTSFTPSAVAASVLTVDNPGVFAVGDQLRPAESSEVMLITAISGSTIVVVRGYGGTTAEAVANNQVLHIIGNAALEGGEPASEAVNVRVRKQNYTQIFTSRIEVSGSQRAVQTIGIADELEYQKQLMLRGLLRDLENCVINGVAPLASPQGSATVRRTLNGILPQLDTNTMVPGVAGIPDGAGSGSDELTEEVLNAAMRQIWDQSSGTIDTIVVGGSQKRKINQFVSQLRGYEPSDTRVRDMVSVYESDFGVARVVLSRWVPEDTVMLLDSSRISVLPLSGRSFHYKPLSSTGDSEVGQLIGEYTLELMNENAHGAIRGLKA